MLLEVLPSESSASTSAVTQVQVRVDLIDRNAQKQFTYTGIKSLPAHDMAVQADQRGAIADRTQENLVSADRAIIAMRQCLITAARELQEGKESVHARNPGAFNVRALDFVAAKEGQWVAYGHGLGAGSAEAMGYGARGI